MKGLIYVICWQEYYRLWNVTRKDENNVKVIVPKDIDPVGKIKRYTDWKVCQSSVKYTCEVDFILFKDRGGFVLQKTLEKEKTIAEWLNKKFDQKFIHGDKTTPDKTVTKPVNENDSIDKSLLFPSHLSLIHI